MEQRLIDEILAARAQAYDHGRPREVANLHRRGHLTSRQCIGLLVDKGSFKEYGVLAEGDPDTPGAAPADGLVGGVATVDAQPVVVMSYDISVHGGTQSRLNTRKIKLIALSHQHRWPLVYFAAGDSTPNRRPRLHRIVWRYRTRLASSMAWPNCRDWPRPSRWWPGRPGPGMPRWPSFVTSSWRRKGPPWSAALQPRTVSCRRRRARKMGDVDGRRRGSGNGGAMSVPGLLVD